MKLTAGMSPLTDNEEDVRIMKHCKPLVRRHHKTVFKVKSYLSHRDCCELVIDYNIEPRTSIFDN